MMVQGSRSKVKVELKVKVKVELKVKAKVGDGDAKNDKTDTCSLLFSSLGLSSQCVNKLTKVCFAYKQIIFNSY